MVIVLSVAINVILSSPVWSRSIPCVLLVRRYLGEGHKLVVIYANGIVSLQLALSSLGRLFYLNGDTFLLEVGLWFSPFHFPQ